jgi:hypothetical protein
MKFPSWTHLFLHIHIWRASCINKTESSFPHLDNTCSTTCKKSLPSITHFWNTILLHPHTSITAGHPHIACTTISDSLSHIGQKGSFTTFLLSKLSFVGNKLWYAIQKKFFVAFGISKFQIVFQKVLSFTCLELFGTFLHSYSFAK